MSLSTDATEEIACCGAAAGPESRPFERPGYALCHFVENFKQTTAGAVPQVKTVLEATDRWGTVRTRLGISRYNYKVAPGLYCAGSPGADSPILITANYKLTFDIVRSELTGLDVWILVLDTHGINVWCAAGKRTFSTQEVIRQVKRVGLEKVVTHRKLILPQLGATGISARDVKKGCGFEVIWGPVRVRDIKPFLDAGMKADTDMRRVTFSFWERLVLIPVELSTVIKYALWLFAGAFLLSGIGGNIFSLQAAWLRGLMLTTALVAGILGGVVLAPALLPWIPVRAFSLKGTITGLITAAGVVSMFWQSINGWEAVVLLFCPVVVSSYLAMNFTGATPFTSPSGVEKEMRKAIPLQTAALLFVIIAWVGSAFAA
jgi:hypothetical protein